MENCVKYDGVGNVFRDRYPFTEDPLILKNNFREVLKIGERKERKLANEGLTKFYESSFSLMNASSSSETEAIQKAQRFQVSECSFSYNRNLSVIHKKHINTGIEKIL